MEPSEILRRQISSARDVYAQKAGGSSGRDSSADFIASGERILLVDAVEDESAGYAAALRTAGYTVVWKNTGPQALAESRVAPPDLIVTDLTLPEFDGFELLARMKGEASTREIPVIMLTGREQPLSVITDGKAAGAAAVRIRPYQPARLLQDVERLLGAGRLKRLGAEQLRLRAREARAQAGAALGQSRLVSHRPCPACGSDLEPVAATQRNGRLYFRPCAGGCGWWFYDSRERQMCKLI
jgi:CheY-like chemotaxis protein